MENQERGLFIGRFQPFHNGHLSTLKQMEKECDEIIIAVGSAQYAFYKENPMTAGERIEAITKALKKEIKKPFYVVPVEDINCYPNYVSHVESLVPKFNVIYTGNSIVAELFAAKNHEVKGVPSAVSICATDIRKAIGKEEQWKHLVPEEVHEFIANKKIDERIRRLENGRV
ncbi:MAG: nicotinamide-nucleotide adenylyltransferase [Nanoarchaeota archaeon]